MPLWPHSNAKLAFEKKKWAEHLSKRSPQALSLTKKLMKDSMTQSYDETFKAEAEAVSIANDTLYGLGAGVWSRDANICYRMGRAIEAGRVWVNCYHSYPAHAAFGGYKNSGIGRETHKMMLNHYQQTKNVLVSYAESPDGFF